MRMNCLVVAAEGGVGPRYGEVLVLAPAQPALASQLELVKINPNLKRVYNIIMYSVITIIRPVLVVLAVMGSVTTAVVDGLDDSGIAVVSWIVSTERNV